jgi:hypothetical protein
MFEYGAERDAAVVASLSERPSSCRPTSAAGFVRPSTASSRSAKSIIKEASCVVACSELQLPLIIGTSPKILASLVRAALSTVDVDENSVEGFELRTGLYVKCRSRSTHESLFVVFKGKQFLAISSAELQMTLDEMMSLVVFRNPANGVPPAALVERYPVLEHRAKLEKVDRFVVVTLVNDHLDSTFKQRTAVTGSKVPFHFNVSFNDLWTNLINFHFFSLRNFREAMQDDEASDAVLSHRFRNWLFLFAFQGRMQSSTLEEAAPALQTLCVESLNDESIAIVWEHTADLSKAVQHEQ